MSNAPFVFEPKNAYSLEELVECGYGRLFGPGKGVLPVDNMLMLDRITVINEDGGEFGRGKIIAELDIRPDLWFFDCHFPGDPVMPGCLGLDALWQLVGFWLCWSGREGKGRALGVGEVKFSGEVLPTHDRSQADHGHCQWHSRRRWARDLLDKKPKGWLIPARRYVLDSYTTPSNCLVLKGQLAKQK